MSIINTSISGGGQQPSGTITITSNTTTNVAQYEYAVTAVPTTAPAHYVRYVPDPNDGSLVKDGSQMIDFTGVTQIGYAGINYAFFRAEITAGANDTYLKPFPNASNLILNNATYMFGYAYFTNPNISFDGVEQIQHGALNNAFDNSNIAKVYFPDLTTILSTAFGTSSTSYTFRGCTSLTEIHFPAALQTDVEAMTGYSAKWGASNATIYFDL